MLRLRCCTNFLVMTVLLYVTVKNDDRLTFNDSQGGTWLEVGIGTDVLLSERTNFYFDIEKTFGGTVKTPYRIEGGFRWEF